MAESVELKACPLCGGTDIYVAPDETGSGGQWVPPVHVGCRACCLDLVDLVTDTREGAIAAWNRRVSPAPSEGGERGKGSSRERDEDLCADRGPTPGLTADSVSPEDERAWCETCGGTGKIIEAARHTGANVHSACQMDCEDCAGEGRR